MLLHNLAYPRHLLNIDCKSTHDARPTQLTHAAAPARFHACSFVHLCHGMLCIFKAFLRYNLCCIRVAALLCQVAVARLERRWRLEGVEKRGG